MASTGSYKQICPSCEAPVLIKSAALIGKKVECAKCKYRFVAEAPKTAADPDAPAAEDKTPPTGTPALKKPAAKKPAADNAVTVKKPAGDKTPPVGTPAPKKKAVESRPLGDDDEDEEPAVKPRKSNTVLFAGVGLAVVALGLLGVGAFYGFGGPGKPTGVAGGPVGPRNTGRPTTATKKTTATEAQPTSLADATNLLPNDADVLVLLDSRSLLNSLIGDAAFRSPGAFQKQAVEEALGLKLDEVDQVLLAVNTAQDERFVVLRTSKPINLEALEAALRLTPADDPPKGQKYYRTPPVVWLDALQRLAAEALHLPTAKPSEARKLAVRVVDAQTLVVADEAPMKTFLEAGGKPKVLTADAKPGPATKDAKPGTTKGAPVPVKLASTHYLTVQPGLKNVLDQIDAKGAGLLTAAAAGPPPLARLAAGRPELAAFDVSGVTAYGLSVRLKDRWDVTLAVEGPNQDFGRKAVDLVKQAGAPTAAVVGIPVEVDGQKFAPPKPPEPAPPPQPNRPRDLKLATTLAGNTFVLTADLGATAGLNNLLVQDVLAPQMVFARGRLDMSGGRLRVFDLADAAGKAAKANPLALRGAAKREGGAFGRPWDPDQRVSWMVQLLPQLGHQDVYDGIKTDRSWRPERDFTDNARLGGILIPAFLDPTSAPATWSVRPPSVPNWEYAATHFVGVAGVGLDAAEYRTGDPRAGVFGYDRETTLADIKDKATTIMILQVPPTYQRPWIAGGGATVVGVPEKGSVAPFVSGARDGKKGTYALMADGSVRYVSDTISDDVFKAMCTLNGGDKGEMDKSAPVVPPPANEAKAPAAK